MKAVSDLFSVRMFNVDQDIAIKPGNDRRDDQNGRALLLIPLLTERLGDRLKRIIPATQGRGAEDFMANTVRNGNLDVMLVWRDAAIAVNEFFEQRGRIMLGRIDSSS